MKAPLEKDIQRVCIDWMKLAGIFVIRINSGAFAGHSNGRKRFVRMNSEPGCSDCVAVLPGGRALAVEFKRPGQKPTPEQASFIAAWNAKGGLALVVTSLEDLITKLRESGIDVH